ncbi:MAG: hypothetical protein CMH56_01125 [Myxococcales bacterium]|nr:hypothetical protein [Myxococcales bacterium]|tara:strand:+ start:4051 stop:5040 length:990 start_codon:yes stop_codon:yes gene_type:complete
MHSPSPNTEAFSKLSALFEAWVHETTTLNNTRVARIIRLVLLDSKGSWLRPQLVFGLGDALGHGLDELLPIAAAAEMMHCASLLHDDVIDEGFSRRGNPTANALHGNVAAVLCGDVLMAQAMTLLSEQAPKAIPHAAKTIAELSNSALMEQDLRYRSDVAMCDWRTVAEQKTGSLLGFCLSSLLPPQQTQQAFELGYLLGQFFQLCDDLKDFHDTGTGKPPYQDLNNGNPNWVTLTLAEQSTGFRQELRHFWASTKSLQEGTSFTQRWDFRTVALQGLQRVKDLNGEIHQLGRVLFNDEGQNLLEQWLNQVNQKAQKHLVSEPALEVAL